MYQKWLSGSESHLSLMSIFHTMWKEPARKKRNLSYTKLSVKLYSKWTSPTSNGKSEHGKSNAKSSYS